MSSEQINALVGHPMPGCEIPIRPDGSVEHTGYLEDPAHLGIVLGADVSPWHEQAIIQACRSPGTDGKHAALWVWHLVVRQPMPAIGLSLWLRPGEIPLPDQAWMLAYRAGALCDICAANLAQQALEIHDHLMADRGTTLTGAVTIVGRDHRVLGVARPECHGLLAAVWQHQLIDSALGEGHAGPAIEGLPAVMSHPAGHPHVLEHPELQRYLLREGWREPASVMRLRRARQRARRRNRP